MAYSKGYRKGGWTKPVVVKVPRIHRVWSQLQKAIFQDIASGTGHTVVIARAGTGKTATIVEGCYHVPAGLSILVLAFNRDIVNEVEARCGEGVVVKSFNSLGNQAFKAVYPKATLDTSGVKLTGYIKAERGDAKETLEVRASLYRAVSLAKGMLAHDFEAISKLIERFDIDLFGDSEDEFANTVLKVLAACKADTKTYDYDDQVWLPLVLNLNIPKFDRVKVDEAQDLTPAQIAISLRACKPNGRITCFGDDRQAIYGFRGADAKAIETIIKSLNAKTLPLNETYRCAKSIVKEANRIVPDIVACQTAEEGAVTSINKSRMEDLIQVGDFLLSRTNAPLIGWALSFLKAGIPANIQGRDLGDTLHSMIRKSGHTDVDGFLEWLSHWKETETEKFIKLNRDPAVIQDKADCLVALCENAADMTDVRNNISKLFDDKNDKNKIVCSTTHRAKGKERDNVFMLKDTFRVGKNKEDDNIFYVAVTRARKNLYYVSDSMVS